MIPPMIPVLATLLTLAGGAAPFTGYVRVERVTDSYWSGRCELVISIPVEDGGESASLSCDGDASREPFTKTRSFGPHEVGKLRDLLRKADLFQGQFWGVDGRSIDLWLQRLTVIDDTRAATLVTSLNESFAKGARHQLLQYLDDIEKSLTQKRE
jgi:hypothetical protein